MLELTDKFLEWYDLKVLRFTNSEVMNDFESVCEILNSY